MDVAFFALDDDFDFAVPFVELVFAVLDDLPTMLFSADDDLFADELLAVPPVLVFADDDFDFALELDDLDAPDFDPADREVDDFAVGAFFVAGMFNPSDLDLSIDVRALVCNQYAARYAPPNVMPQTYPARN